MKNHLKIAIILFFVANIFFATGKASASTTLGYYSKIPSTWTKAGSPYILSAEINMREKLTIEPGVVVKFTPYGRLNFLNGASIKGRSDEKIVFTSIKDDSVGGDDNYDRDNSKPAKGDGYGISFSDYAGVELENVEFSYMKTAINITRYTSYEPYFPNTITLKNMEIKDNDIGISIIRSAPVVENSLIVNNTVGIQASNDMRFEYVAVLKTSSIINNGTGLKSTKTNSVWGRDNFLDVRNNWWGDKAGPFYKHPYDSTKDNLNQAGSILIGDGFLYKPWLGKDPTAEEVGCQENCYSNVMFLPGIKASRLYRKGIMGTDDKLWIPNYFGSDLNELYLNADGKSINNIFTKDVLDEIAIPYIGGNLYKSFMENLATLKENGSINDYNLFSYDWRKNVEDIAQNGTMYPDSELKSAIETVQSLAENSKSKKVTIIAHSNGGLLAKAIMQELEKRGLGDKVDKIVLVGTPQMGTPLSTLSLLYGYDESVLLGSLISRKDARTLAENMPGVYGLLPTQKYFERTQDALITFNAPNAYADYERAYGDKISDAGEFKKFLLGAEGRIKPNANDIEKENILNQKLVDQASDTHSRLDNWTPPENVQVYQIAGWGLDTISGIDYSEKEKVNCIYNGTKVPTCTGIGEHEGFYEPKFTVDGDKVVTAPSALMMSDASKVKKYWVDLYRSDDFFTIRREHKDILESDSIKKFISNVILNKDLSVLPPYIYDDRPKDYENAKSRIRMSLYSPLDIHLYDSKGNHTGPKIVNIDGEDKAIFEEGIPGSYYYQLGERKYVGFENSDDIHVKMASYDSGSYTLKLEEIKLTSNGEEEIAHAAFQNLPTTKNTVVSFEVPESGLDGMTTLKADMDGDGETDYKLDKVLNGTAILDTIAPEIKVQSPKENEKYLNDQVLAIDFNDSDNITEAKNIKTKIQYDEKDLETTEIDLSLEKIGEHTISITVEDEAGNASEKTIDFEIITNINSISKNIDHYFELGLIIDQEAKDFLQTKVAELSHIQEMIAKFESKSNSKPKENQIKLFNKKVEDLVDFLFGKFDKQINENTKEIMIDSLNYVKIKEN